MFFGRRLTRLSVPFPHPLPHNCDSVSAKSFFVEAAIYLLPVSRNHQGRRGTTADIDDNLLPSLTVFGCSQTAVEVETGPLSDVIFPSFFVFRFIYSLVGLYDLLQR